MALWTGGTLGSTVDRGGVNSRHGGASPAHNAPSTAGHGTSPAAAGDEEGDGVEPMRGSPGHERRQRLDVAAMKNGGRLSSARGQRRVRESSRLRGEGAVVARGGGALLYGLGEGREGGNGRRLMVLMPLMAGWG
jgi:hypothetical protein